MMGGRRVAGTFNPSCYSASAIVNTSEADPDPAGAES